MQSLDNNTLTVHSSDLASALDELNEHVQYLKAHVSLINGNCIFIHLVLDAQVCMRTRKIRLLLSYSMAEDTV